MKAGGAKGFDAYAHHPYYGSPAETPTTKPPPGKRGQPPTAVTLGNFDAARSNEIDRLYGKQMRVWVTEYGYQTNPPDKIFGVTLPQAGDVPDPGGGLGATESARRPLPVVPAHGRAALSGAGSRG